MSEGSGFDPELFGTLARVEPRSFWFRARRRLIVSTLRRYFPTADSLLEVGCGTGYVLEGLRAAFPRMRLVGTDLFSEGLEVARQRVPGVELVQADLKELGFAAEFDVAGAFDVLEHIDDDEQALAALARAVRPGGGVVLLVPQHPWLWSELDELGRHRRRYTRPELTRKVAAAGLAVAFASSFVTSLLPAMVLARAARRLRPGRLELASELQPGRLNGVFERILDAERRLIERGISLPAGGSLLVVARKPPAQRLAAA
jgi:SAM-dependent methyltransferase